MAGEKTPARERAIESILRIIVAESLSPGDKLPNMRTLASRAGVSLVTAWKAAAILKKRGVLVCRRGSAVRVGPEAPTAPGSPDESPHDASANRGSYLWQRVAGALEQRVLQGHYPPGTRLPSYKELQAALGISYRPLRRALTALEAKGIITASGRGHTASPLSARRPGNARIVLFAHRGREGMMRISVGGDDFLYEIERACARAGIAFDRVLYHGDKDRLHLYDPLSETPLELKDQPEVLGYIVLAIHHEPGHAMLFRRLAPMRKPVAVLTNIPYSELSVPSRHGRYFRHFVSGTTEEPGRDVARFLLNLGHRRIAWISPFHKDDWSRKRLRGLDETMRAAGYDRGVIALTRDFHDRPRRGGDPNEAPSAFAKVHRSVGRIRAHSPAGVQRALDRGMAAFRTATHAAAEIGVHVDQLLDRAMSEREATAWVAANDAVALPALDYLRAHSIAVPQRISLVGFDNSLDGAQRLITSYDFNLGGIADAVLSYLLKTGYFAVRRPGAETHVHGMLIERATTGAARPRKRRSRSGGRL